MKRDELVKFALANVPKTGWLPVELRTASYAGPTTPKASKAKEPAKAAPKAKTMKEAAKNAKKATGPVVKKAAKK
jgi:ParB family transcriptional regulator, chromosome partitioning protein